jgi:hypothetical protein
MAGCDMLLVPPYYTVRADFKLFKVQQSSMQACSVLLHLTTSIYHGGPDTVHSDLMMISMSHMCDSPALGATLASRSYPPAQVWEIDCGGKRGRAAAALRLLAQELGAGKPEVVPGVNCKGAFAGPWRPDIPAAGV